MSTDTSVLHSREATGLASIPPTAEPRSNSSTESYIRTASPTNVVENTTTGPDSLSILTSDQDAEDALTSARDHPCVTSQGTRAVVSLFVPAKKIVEEPTKMDSLKAIVFASWLNPLLIFVPISWALNFALDPDKSSNKNTVVFVTVSLAIIPLVRLLSFGTEQLAIRLGQTLGGLLHVTLRNVVELLVGTIALVQGRLRVVQSSLVGSILSNLLLVLGTCFFAGGTRFAEQGFMETGAQLNVSLLVLSVTAILIPAVFKVATTWNPQHSDQEGDVLRASHGVAVILLANYISYLIFQLWSHAHLYNEKSVGNDRSPSKQYPPKNRARSEPANNKVKKHSRRKKSNGTSLDSTEELMGRSNRVEGTSTVVQDGTVKAEKGLGTSAEDEETPQLTVAIAIGLLVMVVGFMSFTTVHLVTSVDGLTKSGYVPAEWAGLILLPLLGDVAELVTAVSGSVKDKLDISIGVAVGSSIQIALFVLPFLVIWGWIIEKPLTFLFDPFESIVLFLAVLTVAFGISHGRSNWLEGVILLGLYCILATVFWWYPGS
ncbi:Sodium/calcium exchanger protein-domain-containing protein [Cantharellus anzutake]|uniref:Sodium/calcium exchanger protein-domain-containing protein n=1 Tax=Cantharellus anzutake TaxID=1750568 RepID=UPI001905409E|nr:Sodium/calcium exchanger protein-domain-containing protein [Cantharellus anzutake]KAF8340727.1 Sodium/calcium exchanger protein-domain-containing protein [Cantharellus anzutake]